MLSSLQWGELLRLKKVEVRMYLGLYTRCVLTYGLLVVQLHHGEQDVGLEQVAPAPGILIHPALQEGRGQQSAFDNSK